jgi:hypothetical protein
MNATFFRRETLRVLGSRPAWLAMAAMAYGLFAFPVIVAKPPPDLRPALEAWFGLERFELRLILFAWFDLVMNKLAVFSAAILSASILTDERSRNLLDVYLSKPTTVRRYFVVKALAAAAALSVLYTALTLTACGYFAFMLPGFVAVPFLKMALVHLFGAVFASLFAALMAVTFAHKLSALLASLFVLSMAVGLAFGAFYQPAWATLFAFNPMSQAVSLIAIADTATAAQMAMPIAVLVIMCAATLGVGVLRAGRAS